MGDRYAASELRTRHDAVHVTATAAADLTGFKAKSINFKIGFWDPEVNGVRYLKALTYGLATGLSAATRESLRRVRNRDLGAPITVTVDGDAVCMDYLQAVLELEFVADRLDLGGRRVLEIGAGYGRFCHTVLSNHDVAEYCIVDLPNSLVLSRGYLSQVLTPAQFAKVRFVPAEQVDDELGADRFDLGLVVNALAEMPRDTVTAYLDLVRQRCGHFYVKDPVGKYLDSALDGHSEGSEVVRLALSTGALLDVLDVHDSDEVAARAPAFVDAYRPGPGWSVVADGWARPWSFYWQALYRDDAADR